MRFDQKTVKVLDNFATINKTMYFHTGPVMVTMNESNSILARAPLPEPIARDFGIRDLSMALTILKLFSAPTIEIVPEGEDETFLIKEGDQEARITLAPLNLIKKPSKDEVKLNPDVTFKLPSQTIQVLSTAASCFGHTELIFRSHNGNVLVETVNIGNPTTDKFVKVLGKTDKKFKVPLKLINFLVMIADYDATISFSKKAFFHLKNAEVEYYMPAENNKHLEVQR
jgi:hypothetical protein